MVMLVQRCLCRTSTGTYDLLTVIHLFSNSGDTVTIKMVQTLVTLNQLVVLTVLHLLLKVQTFTVPGDTSAFTHRTVLVPPFYYISVDGEILVDGAIPWNSSQVWSTGATGLSRNPCFNCI